MSCTTIRKLAGSVNLEKALKNHYPNDPRWDYGIGLDTGRHNDRVLWVEVHPASSGKNVKEMIKKLHWLRQWIEHSAPEIKKLADMQFLWISSNGVHISKNTPQARELAQEGIRFPQEYLNLDQCYPIHTGGRQWG
jgi:hypothetical protein